jgi:LuxR family maltose regulon positive regulatory protein
MTQTVYERWASQGQQASLIHARIVQSLLCAEDTDKSMAYLAEALASGKPEGFIRSFVDFGMEMAPLLREAIARGIKADYARQLLGIIEAEDRRRRTRKVKDRASSLASGLLSVREIEVLQLVAEGLSNQQIAGKLTVSLSTAKTHVHRLFQKLDATDRLQAVNRARELKLI